MTIGLDNDDLQRLRNLNRRSWTHTFSPEVDIDWNSSTTAEEYRALYDNWSLFVGTRHEHSLDDDQRNSFARCQQVNLMLATALFERCALANFESLYRDDSAPEFQEYVAHLVKEETYHHVLFTRAIKRILESDPELAPPPERLFRIYLSVTLFLLRIVPGRRLRHGMFFYVLRFIEEITLQANIVARKSVPRRDSLVPRVWELHAIDEARHVAFDELMMRKARLPGALRKLPAWLALPLCVGASLLINISEVRAARQLGVRVGYHELPVLMKRTRAAFKLRVFGLLFGGSGHAKGHVT